MASQSSQYHVLNYKYVPDILEKRGPHRDAHLGAARKQVLSNHYSVIVETNNIYCC